MADALQDHLDAEDLEHDLSEAFQDRVIVSRNGTTIFLPPNPFAFLGGLAG